MAAGKTFLLGEQKIRPGTYVRWTNIGEPAIVTGARGIAAAVIKASWGPLNKPVVLEGLNEVATNFGYGKGPDVLRDLFRGGARRVVAVRVGSGGSKATVMLQDMDENDAVKLETKYETSRQIKVTVRDSLTQGQRQLLVYDGETLLETISFDKGTSEPEELTNAVNNQSAYLTAEKLAESGALAAVTDKALTGGSDPVVTGESYVNGFEQLETEVWNILVVDSEDVSVHASVQAFIYNRLTEGYRVMAVIGEPTSVSLDERLQHARSYNDPAIVYVGNGFVAAGEMVEGARAAARIAGEILRSDYTSSLTHHVIQGATEVVGKLTNAQVERAIQSGMLVFTTSASGLVQVEYGITTFTTPTADMDLGWSKIRRVRTRYELIDRIVLTLDPYVGKLNNSPDGRAMVVSVINGIIQQMIAEGGLEDGAAYEDPERQPQGDSAWFRIDVDDLDSMEKVYFTFGFRFSRPAGTTTAA